jgi:hypothetical protein
MDDALRAAVKSGDVEATRAALDGGASVHGSLVRALCSALCQPARQRLVSVGPPSCRTVAAAHPHSLACMPAAPLRRVRQTESALHWAAQKGHTAVAKLLLERGAELEWIDNVRARALRADALRVCRSSRRVWFRCGVQTS